VQSSIFNQEGIAEIRKLGGASGAILFNWLGHGYYAAKRFSSNYPYTLVSEWLCADIASLINLPIPSRQVIVYNGQKWLGFEWRDNGNSFEMGMESKLMNPEVVAGMLAFDVLVCNRDRHRGNILLQHPSPDMGGYTLHIIDHSHALIGNLPNYDTFVEFIGANLDPDAFLRVAPVEIRSLVQCLDDFAPWVKRINRLTRTQIESSVTHMPREWRPMPDDTTKLVDFLVERKAKIAGLIKAGVGNFPACN